jgi:predicted peroxiredoxin
MSCAPPPEKYREIDERPGQRAEAGHEQAHKADLRNHQSSLRLYAGDVAERRLVVKVTAGADAPERCSQAFTVAATAAAAGVDVSLWLTGESAWFALPGRAERFELPHAAPLADLLSAILAAGTVTLCTQCAARRDIKPDDVVPGIRIAGAASFVEEILANGATALVY